MSGKIVTFILFLVLLINAGAIFSIEYERHREKNKKSDDIPMVEVKRVEEGKEDVKDQKEEISTSGLFVNDAKAKSTPNYRALEKSNVTQTKIQKTGHWVVTNYVYGDITTNIWKVRRGDTLWEISEAWYGSGSKWTKIRDLNSKKVYKNRDGLKILIVPGQTLRLK